jgi:hypothetical protein
MNFITSLFEVAQQDGGFDQMWLLKIIKNSAPLMKTEFFIGKIIF